MEKLRKLSQNYHQILLLNTSSDASNIFQNWGNIQSLLRRTNRGSIKHRVKEFQESGGKVDENVEKQAENILKEIPKSYALSASLSATTFYEWVSLL